MSEEPQNSTWVEYINLYDFYSNLNKGMELLSEILTKDINQAIKECITDGFPLANVAIRYHNITDNGQNSDGSIGTFRITATRGNGDPESSKQWEAAQ